MDQTANLRPKEDKMKTIHPASRTTRGHPHQLNHGTIKTAKKKVTDETGHQLNAMRDTARSGG
ncbi:MAG: hypothetical protein HYS45_02075 [Parcubacteria group bacterium]|nr:hypothetical protein [Parcubacteria group bacterium]